MFSIHSWPQVILHVDGDAFFASVMQAARPHLKGKPVITGHERGIATAISYEAKKYGVKRGMTLSEIKKLCPTCHFVESDYELFSLFSKRMFEIIKQFSPVIEEYSIDEGFVDLKGLQRPLHMNYEAIGKKMKETIESNLGITVSVGISLTKSLAKLASNFKKPSGLTVIQGPDIESFLVKIPIQKVWGIGPQTAAYLQKWGVKTAFDFVSQTQGFITKHLSKPFFEIWQELQGKQMYAINPEAKTTYSSISKTQTFYPPTSDKNILWSRLLIHIEDAFNKARRYHYAVGSLFIFLKTQEFRYHGREIKLASKTSYPALVRDEIKQAFEKIYQPQILYRTTGCTISDLVENKAVQETLFQNSSAQNKMEKIYPLLDAKKISFGTCLYDKTTLSHEKKEIKPSIPYLSLKSLG
ncbi:DNA polymerase IV [Candidatus Roizmanbacteria bacterium CG_4_10_14_0_8_um_filter_39_9]|uniref:DNA polymerase IV n=1 Tax=Candidatus Roizmanbacteria bacterium CG_4_10_14_0_8_um_filter_39_9 TaxID=1974829 RepID=A0A2M7QEY9_9BACT|nr:MAG: DNA polymerase IV [Candidatus Roizmanbacteria bacterium CG_4_10_14_0_8_um_filter_39_9]